MKTLILTATVASFALSFMAPAFAGVKPAGVYSAEMLQDAGIDKRRKPRIKGGSGCDDPRDLIEHPECR